MYNVSQAYKDAIRRLTTGLDMDSYVAGTITLADNTVITVVDDDIANLRNTNQCVSKNGFSIGHTHTGEQELILHDNVTNYRRFHGAKIELIYYLKVSSTEYEGVPLGIFEVVEATRPTATTIKLVGYDNMTKFDVDYPLSVSERYSMRTPFERLKDLCTALGVELWDSDANVQAQLNLMPNGTLEHSLAFTRIVTARDYLDYLCQLLCGFATIDRLGRLRIVCWRLKGTITGYAIPDNLRKKSTFNDTVLKYSAVNMSVSFYEGADGKFVKNITAPEIPTGAGEVLSLYSNALIRGTLYNNAQTILDNIADVMTNTDPENGTVMQWIPCDIQYTGDPALDLGDWVTYTGYTAGDGIEVPIHRIDWKYRGWQRLETLDINRKSERENNANRARQEELATIIKSGVGARSIGEHAEIFNDYENNIASGNYSHASGRGSTASGETSFASGNYATASGLQSVALGGNNTQAIGSDSVAMGGGKAMGDNSLAVGFGCEAKGRNSVALGGSSVANSSYSIAIGYDNSATGYAAVAMGDQSKTTGDRGFAMGYKCEAASAAVAMGNISKATDSTSIAIGSSNTSSGMSSVTLGGSNNSATKSGAVCIGGASCNADGDYSAVLGGYNNTTNGVYSAVLGGQNNVSGGMRAVAMGNETIAKGDNQLALGKYNVEDTTNQYALVIGGGTSSVRKNIFTVDWAGNVECTGTVNGAEVEVVDNLTSTSTTSALSANQGRLLNINKVDKVAGKDLSTNDYTNIDKAAVDDWDSKKTRFLNGTGTNSIRLNDSSNSANGDYSVSGGYDCNANGHFSTAFGYGCSTAGFAGFAAGLFCETGTELGAVAMGEENIASGRGACALGSQTTASGDGSVAMGFSSLSSGAYQLALGKYNVEDTTNQYALIVGGGTFTERKNILTLDWQGNLEVDGSIMSYLTIGIRVGTVGDRSFAQGNNVEASGINSHAEGRNTTASGINSHAEGSATTASGDYSHAEGRGTTAGGKYSHAEGYNTTASGDYSHAEGRETTASGDYSHAEGYITTASGKYSHAQNRSTIAQGLAQTAIGRYNKAQGDPTTIISTDDAFIIGNGTDSARSNAFRVTFDGKTYGLSAFNSSGADYAEFFEWADGNPNNEDRVGYFVALDGEKIRIARPSDDYIVGVVSANASVIGDSASENWDKKYVTDIYGRVQYHWVDIQAVIVDGEEIEPARQDYLPVINPDWDSTVDYVPREKRKEWSAVGIMGKLIVRDDGTCQANGYCCVADGGIATTSDIGYRVLSRLDDNHIKVLIK